MPIPCDICNEGPAAVFTPTAALCKPCKRDLDRLAIDDNPIPNALTCAVCGGVLERNDFCGWCDAQAARAFNERLAHVG